MFIVFCLMVQRYDNYFNIPNYLKEKCNSLRFFNRFLDEAPFQANRRQAICTNIKKILKPPNFQVKKNAPTQEKNMGRCIKSNLWTKKV